MLSKRLSVKVRAMLLNKGAIFIRMSRINPKIKARCVRAVR
jgi:hypothetical protein